MTTVALVFLTLFTWMVSSGTWLGLERCAELSQYGRREEAKGCSSSALHKNDKTKLTLTCERSPNMSFASERIFTKDKIKKDCTICPAVTSVAEKLKVCKCKFQQLLVSKTSCLLLTTEAHNPSKRLNYIIICPSSVLLRYVAHCSQIISPVPLDHWKTLYCICKTCSLEVKILQRFLHRGLGPVSPEFFVFILYESPMSLTSSEESEKANVRICSVEMPLKSSASRSPEDTFLTQADGITCIVYTGRVESVRPADTSTWVARYFLAAVLLLGVYVTRIKILSNRVVPAHGSNSTMVMLFTVTLRWFSPSVTVHQPSEWSRIAVGISFALCLSCALGRTVHVFITVRAAHTVMKLFCPTQQQFRALPVTVLFIWLTFSPPFPSKSVKHWFEDILVEGSVGSILRSWAVLGQIELLATLYCMCVSLPSLLHSILTKVNFLSVLLHVQLVTCLQNSRVPTKYIMVVKISRFI